MSFQLVLEHWLENFQKALGKVHLIWQGGNEDIEGTGGLRKFLDTQKGGSEKIVAPREGGLQKLVYRTSKTTGRGGGGAAKISSFEFQYLHPPLPY